MTRDTGNDDAGTRLLAKNEPRVDHVATYVITVVEGPDAGARITLDGAQPSRVLVGHGPACELRLTDPHVSRRHASVQATPRGLHVMDLGSTNGTWANRAAIVDAYFMGGDLIGVGNTVLRVDLAAAPRAVPLSSATSFGRVFGASAGMRRLYPLCERLAASDVPVVIEGETGTGKEFLAEAIHETSPRAQGPFIVFDCTAVPPNLVESSLFGHERGAFTGASSTRKGVFELAHGGTLLIDEIGDLDLAMQPKLLRALERYEVQRVGGDKWIRVNVRVLAATRRDLDQEVLAGRFREDLFFRLVVARVELPPLRERHGDIGLLARHFWRKMCDRDEPIPEELVARFESYAFPGNVRELRNAVARSIALGDLEFTQDRQGSPSTRPPSLGSSPAQAGDQVLARVLDMDLPLPVARQHVVDAFERLYVERVLDRHNGNVTRAAHASGIARRYFYTLRTRLGV